MYYLGALPLALRTYGSVIGGVASFLTHPERGQLPDRKEFERQARTDIYDSHRYLHSLVIQAPEDNVREGAARYYGESRDRSEAPSRLILVFLERVGRDYDEFRSRLEDSRKDALELIALRTREDSWGQPVGNLRSDPEWPIASRVVAAAAWFRDLAVAMDAASKAVVEVRSETSTPTDSRKVKPKTETNLRAREELILEAFDVHGCGPFRWCKVAELARLKADSQIRADLSELIRLGYLTNDGSGYRRTDMPYPSS
jgi:hypothetical protein